MLPDWSLAKAVIPCCHHGFVFAKGTWAAEAR
jgi:hypothetical protein